MAGIKGLREIPYYIGCVTNNHLSLIADGSSSLSYQHFGRRVMARVTEFQWNVVWRTCGHAEAILELFNINPRNLRIVCTLVSDAGTSPAGIRVRHEKQVRTMTYLHCGAEVDWVQMLATRLGGPLREPAQQSRLMVVATFGFDHKRVTCSRDRLGVVRRWQAPFHPRRTVAAGRIVPQGTWLPKVGIRRRRLSRPVGTMALKGAQQESGRPDGENMKLPGLIRA